MQISNPLFDINKYESGYLLRGRNFEKKEEGSVGMDVCTF